uniref:Uncharacterized protein n=1 Tax=Dictyoglomus turgidum TaxID=513050 RepID=A0A7C3WUH1_9BACT
MPYPWSPGDKLYAADLNAAVRQAYKNFQAAENLIVNDAVVINPDGKIQKARADFNDWRIDNFIGFNVAPTASGIMTVSGVQISGIRGGFSGLIPGADYYLSNTPGAISTSPGTYRKKVGIAVSSTELLILSQKSVFNPTTDYSSNTVYQAKHDGIVVAYVYGTPDGSSIAPSLSVYGYTDANPNPTTRVAANAQAYPQAIPSGSSVAVSITFPVKKGDYWKVSMSYSRLSVETSIRFYELV